MNNTHSPLVSILVFSYNSSETIIETLDSAYHQTYQNIELLISDDCSSDNTVCIAERWIKKYNDRFVRCKLITSIKNTGISCNCNRGISHCDGEWIKSIAADDILLPSCIENFVNHVDSNTESLIFFSPVQPFHKSDNGDYVDEDVLLNEDEILNQNQMTAREQFLCIIKGKGLKAPAPSAFYKKSLMCNYPFSEIYKGLEDVPQWTKLTKNGIKLSFIKEVTVRYRRGDTVSNASKVFFPETYWYSKRLFFWMELHDYLIEEGLYEEYNRYRQMLLLSDLTDCFIKNKVNRINNLIYKFLCIFSLRFVRFPDITKKNQ